MKSRVFVGSSREGLPIARAIKEELDYDFEVVIWNQGIFNLTSTTLDDLKQALDGHEFGIFVLSPDDVLKIREETVPAARDNVVFELGMFIGKLGKEKCFFFIPRGADLHLPSDLTGVNAAEYDPGQLDKNAIAAVGTGCNKIRTAIKGRQTFTKEESAQAATSAPQVSTAPTDRLKPRQSETPSDHVGSIGQPATRLGVLWRELKSPKPAWMVFTLATLLALLLIFELLVRHRDPLGMKGTKWTYTTDLGENSDSAYRKLRGTNFFIDFDGFNYTMNGSREFALARGEKNENNWQRYDPPIPIEISRVSYSPSPPTFYFYFEVQGIKQVDEGKGFVELPIDPSNKSKMVGAVYYLHNTEDEKTKDEKKTWSKAIITFEKQQ